MVFHYLNIGNIPNNLAIGVTIKHSIHVYDTGRPSPDRSALKVVAVVVGKVRKETNALEE
jgi:hypothetical protein